MPVKTADNVKLTTGVDDLPGIGPRQSQALRAMGIRSAADLIRHFPHRYDHLLGEQSIQAAGVIVGPHHGAEALVAVRGEVGAVRPGRTRKAPFQATLMDGTGTVQLIWFNAPWMKGRLNPGMQVRASGKAKRHGDYLQLINPRLETIGPDGSLPESGEGYTPVYPASEDVSSATIQRLMTRVLPHVLPTLDDHLHEGYRRQAAIPALADAYRMIHQPESQEEIDLARRRLALDELLLLQLAVMIKRRHRTMDLQSPALKHSVVIDKRIRARFPFTLTRSQDVVVRDIVADLTQQRPMNRLLQGDVGAGKTAVALYAMLMAVANRQQAALMAPTEILAEQHFQSIQAMLKGGRVRTELLTGSLKPAERRDVHSRLAAGNIDILIGTHALLTETVAFKSLAVVVIDEQHRFGVHQRAQLRAKAADRKTSPHVLVMTATPIPRTLSLTLFGDLDISTIRDLPPGRRKVITRAVASAKAGEVYMYLAERVSKGDQAFIVVPVIDETRAGSTALTTHLKNLQDGALAGKRLGAVHGRMRRDEREEVMEAFRAGKLDAIVATTVIEVGVDVPNASIMVIEQADRFGMSQLHQLRGRIGRGERQSLCVLIADPATEDGTARVQTIVGTTNGFVIAEKDMELRGPGELFGARQSGEAPFHMAKFPGDLKLLEMARRDAEVWINENPRLEGPRDALLKKRLLKAHGEMFGLGDVA